MSLKYGLNIKKKAPAVAPTRRTLLDDDEEEEGKEEVTEEDEKKGRSSHAASHPSVHGSSHARDHPPTVRAKDHANDHAPSLSSLSATQRALSEASSLDPNLLDYDAFHSAKSALQARSKAQTDLEARERKPKYIDALVSSAARRKQDQMVAREKVLRREREDEGEDALGEKFVTEAYKAQREEVRRVEEAERRKEEEEEERRRRNGGQAGLGAFYRGYMEGSERRFREVVEGVEGIEKEHGAATREGDGEAPSDEPSDAALAARARAQGRNVLLNDEGAVVDKRDLLSAGLNLAPSRDRGQGRTDDASAEHLRSSRARAPHEAFASLRDGRGNGEGGPGGARERQSRRMEEQLAAKQKRAREDEEAQREEWTKKAKSNKSEGEISDAKARYLARKAAREKGMA